MVTVWGPIANICLELMTTARKTPFRTRQFVKLFECWLSWSLFKYPQQHTVMGPSIQPIPCPYAGVIDLSRLNSTLALWFPAIRLSRSCMLRTRSGSTAFLAIFAP